MNQATNGAVDEGAMLPYPADLYGDRKKTARH